MFGFEWFSVGIYFVCMWIFDIRWLVESWKCEELEEWFIVKIFLFLESLIEGIVERGVCLDVFLVKVGCWRGELERMFVVDVGIGVGYLNWVLLVFCCFRGCGRLGEELSLKGGSNDDVGCFMFVVDEVCVCGFGVGREGLLRVLVVWVGVFIVDFLIKIVF